jgi:hypothetical protein
LTVAAGNGNSTHTGGNGLAPVLESLGVLEPLERQAEAHAASSRTTKETTADIEVLDALAEARVNQIPSTPFDPATNIADRIRQHEYDRAVEERAADEAAVVVADAHVRERRREQSLADRGLAQPSVPLGELALFVLALAISFAPTLRDELFIDVPDAALGWFFAILGAAVPASMIVWPTLTPHASPSRGKLNWLGTTAAIGFGLANLIIRESNPAPNHMLAIGLTAWEIMVVLFLEWYAQQVRAQYAAWTEQETAKLTALNRYRDAEQQLQHARSQLADRERRLASFVEYVEARTVLHARHADVVAAAKATARHVHRRKVNENFGVRIGAEWRTS